MHFQRNIVNKICQKYNIIFESTTIEKYTENNFENEARNKRYTFYQELLKKYEINR